VPPVASNGLLGKYYPNGDWEPPEAFAQIDPWINFYVHVIPLPRPYTVEWEGEIVIPQSGQYIFGLDSRDESFLYIDGQQVVANLLPGGSQEGTVMLEQGLHEIRVRFADRTSYTNIHLYWTPPGGPRQAVPSEVLFPPQGSHDISAFVRPQPSTPSVPPGQETATAGPIQPAPQVTTNLLWEVGSCGSGPQQFQSPQGIALDRQGNVYVADTGNHRVVKVSPEGQVLLTFGREGNGEGEFVEPVDLVVEADDKIVVMDADNGRLQRFSPDGSFQASFGTNLTTYHPRGLGMDAAGDLYVSDTGGLRLLRLSPGGEVLQSWGADGTGIGAGQPVDAAAAPDGSIYLIEAEQGVLWRLPPDGRATRWTAISSAATVVGPHIGVGPDDLVYVTDPEQGRIVVYRPSGQPVVQFGKRGDGSGQFLRPAGIAVDASGRVYVSDSEICRVQAFGPIGAK
jgi:DNA-binding beta-propeller fold protein YncE